MLEKQSNEKVLCLTFDDGPSKTMEEILSLLKAYDAKVTFFVVGDRIAGKEAILQQTVADGHEVGNHSWTHQGMGEASFSAEMIRREIEETQTAVNGSTGVTPRYFRPPYLSTSQLLQETVEMPFITMSADTKDYEKEATPQSIFERAVAGARDGAILLMHCFEGNTKTVEALHKLLPWCKEAGYRLITVSEMFAEKRILPVNGRYYRSAAQIHQKGLYE